MKKCFFICMLLIMVHCSHAQSASPEVIGSSGSSFNNGTSQLDWTVGESVILTGTSGSDVITQGFHQPNLIITAIDKSDQNNLVSIFPNPTIDLINLKSKFQNNSIQIFNVDGKLLYSNVFSSSEFQVDLSSFAPGVYLLTIGNQNAKPETYRITKSN